MGALAEIIKNKRISMGFSVAKACKIAKISPTYLRLIENGERVPQDHIVRSIAYALNLDDRELVLRANVEKANSENDYKIKLNDLNNYVQNIKPYLAIDWLSDIVRSIIWRIIKLPEIDHSQSKYSSVYLPDLLDSIIYFINNNRVLSENQLPSKQHFIDNVRMVYSIKSTSFDREELSELSSNVFDSLSNNIPWCVIPDNIIAPYKKLLHIINYWDTDKYSFDDINTFIIFINNWLKKASHSQLSDISYQESIEERIYKTIEAFWGPIHQLEYSGNTINKNGNTTKRKQNKLSKIPGLGERLKKAREDAGLSIDQAAKKLGVSIESIDGWESDQSDPALLMLVKICELYDVNSHILLTGSPAPLGLSEAVKYVLKSEPGRGWTVKEVTEAVNKLIESGQFKIQF